MSILKKLGAITGASALVGAGLVAVSGSLAMAAPMTASWDSAYYVPGDTATLTVAGCEAGGTANVGLPGASEYQKILVPESGVIAPIEFTTPDDRYGNLEADVYCTTTENPTGDGTDATAAAYVLGSKLTAVPSSFKLGDTIEVTAGEFVPGDAVTLKVNTQAGKTVWTMQMGTAGEDKEAVSKVTFPDTLECGTYIVNVSSKSAVKANEVEAELYMCGATPTPTPSATSSASSTPTVKPSPSKSPTKAPTKKPGKPGLPHTGA